MLASRTPRVRPAAVSLARASRACCATAAAATPGAVSAHQLAALARWLRAHGVDVSRVRFARTSSAGAGLVAARDVLAGSKLLALPLEACASTPAGAAAAWSPIALTSDLPLALAGPLGALGRALAATDAAARLCDVHAPGLRGGRAYNATHAALLAAALLHQRGSGEAAHWAAYVAALPATLHTPCLWTSAQLARLAGSPVAAAAAARASAVAAAHAALAPALAAAEVPAPLRTPAAFAWAHATVLARAFDVPSMSLLALAPGLDLCNHGGGAGGEHVATVALEGGGGAYGAATCAGRAGAQPPALVLHAGAAGALEGEGVTHRYAGDTAAESLLEFGFVDGLRDLEDAVCINPARQADPPAPAVVPLDLSALLLAPAAADVAPAPPAARLAALHAAGLCAAPLRAFEASSVGVAALSGAPCAADAAAGELMLPRRALAAARALVASADELAAAASARNSSLRVPLSPPAEARAAAALLEVVRTAQRGYATQQQPPPRDGSDDARRARLADAVVHGERRVLQALEAALELRRARALAGTCMRDDDDGDADAVVL